MNLGNNSTMFDYIKTPFSIINVIILTPLLFITLVGINMIKEYNFQKSKKNLLKKSN